ncbi:MAG: hypothetical protein ACQEXB_18525 [Bacillota bacterium]
MNPPLQEQLKKWKSKHQVSTPRKNKCRQKPQKPKSELLTESDIKSLMGMGQRGLRRGKGGAWK